MEPVTHFLTGAVLSRAGFNRKAAYATLAMTLAAEAPDIDILWGLRGPLAGFEHHRGITHTLVFAPVMALAVTGVVWLIHHFRRKPVPADPKLPPPRWLLLWCFALIAVLSHLLLDFTNNYGLRPFFPFNPHWYAWSIVFIFDPLIFSALLCALVLPWLFGLADREIGARRKPFRGRGWAIAALTFIVLWWALRNAEHAHAIATVRSSGLTAETITHIGAEPYPVNPFHWRVIAETRDYYQMADVHTLGDNIQPDPDLIYKPPVTLAVAAAKRSWLGRVYLDWSKFPLVTDFGNFPVPYKNVPQPQPSWHTVEFQDLRFSYPALSIGGGQNRNPLGAWAYIGPGNEVEGIFMSGREQK